MKQDLLKITAFIACMMLPYRGSAAEEQALEFGRGYDTLGISYAFVPVHQASTDMDAGGSYEMTSVQARLGILEPVSRGMLVGASLSYQQQDYDFNGASVFGSQSPWDKIHGLDFGVPLLGRLDEKWSYLLAPSIGTYGESGAARSDMKTYGVVAAAGYTFEPGRRIGFGVGAFERLDQSKLFPFVSINWQLTDRLRLSNPLRAGPTGAAGLELSYQIAQGWEGGAGIARRNFRFRLDDSGVAAGGIGEQISRLAYARLTKTLGRTTRLGAYVGAVRKGTLNLRDANNALVATTDHDTAAMVSLSLEGRF